MDHHIVHADRYTSEVQLGEVQRLEWAWKSLGELRFHSLTHNRGSSTVDVWPQPLNDIRDEIHVLSINRVETPTAR